MNKSPRDRIIDIYSTQMQQRPSSAMGIVKKTYADKYVCDVVIIDNNSSLRGSISSNVPLPMVGGMSYSLPQIGDKVMINFIGNDPNFPYIVAVYPATTASIAQISTVPISISQHIKQFE